MNEELFCALAKGLNRQLIFELKDGQPVELHQPRIKNLLRLNTPKPVFNELVILEGANEMSFNVTFHGKEDFESSSITINGYSYTVRDKLVNIISRKTFKLNCSYLFFYSEWTCRWWWRLATKTSHQSTTSTAR